MAFGITTARIAPVKAPKVPKTDPWAETVALQNRRLGNFSRSSLKQFQSSPARFLPKPKKNTLQAMAKTIKVKI